MQEQTEALTDDQATALLTVIARGHEQGGAGFVTEGTAELAAALRDGLGVVPGTGSMPSDGEAARAALGLLAEDARFADALAALLQGPPPQKLELGTVGTTLLIAGVLLALQTHVKIERDAAGRWKVKIEKKPTSDKLLAPLLKKLTALLGL
jgi:hypothetical protein